MQYKLDHAPNMTCNTANKYVRNCLSALTREVPVAVIDQINTRIDPAIKARYDAAAAAMDETASSLFREILEKNLPDIEKRAEEAVAARQGWPGTIPQAAVEAAIQTYMRNIARTEPLKVLPRELYGVEGKALYTLLSWIWADDSEAEAKARKKIAAWLETLNIKAEITAHSVAHKPAAPESKPIKNYPRRSD